jgi:hypothetical protein
MKSSAKWLLTTLLIAPSVGLAVSTRSFVIDTSPAFEKGTLTGTASYSSGKLTRAVNSERTPLDGVPVAYASAVGRDGAIYVATGNEGAIYRVDEHGSKLFADTPAALVTSLVWVDTTLYAGSLPEGRIFAIGADGKAREHAKLAGADHVWALAYASQQRTLYAATGPEGKLFAIDAQGRARVVHDDQAEHLLCLGLDAEERVYAGTSDGARLVRISGAQAAVLYDFPGQELTTLAIGAMFLAVASNDFPTPPPPMGEGKDLGALARTKRLKPGKGTVYTLEFDGSVQELETFESAHVSALEVDAQANAVQVGLAHEGRIVRLSRSGERALWADVEERQIAAIHLGGENPHFLSSDGVAVYRVREPKSEGSWTSAVLDAKTPARFGELNLRGQGAIRWSTRSGNTETPDASWSAWSAETSAAAAAIKSAPARFLQVRAKLVGEAELYAVEAYYLPQNVAPRVRNVRPKPAKSEDADKGPVTSVTLTWDVDNVDEDKLRYRVFVRREGQTAWRPLLRETELLEQSDYTWETRAVPDGHYRVRVVASDELHNPESYARSAEAISAPLLVDNRAPELQLSVVNGKLTGRAIDALGPVTNLEYAIDSELYRPLFPSDDLLDTRDERFSIALPPLAPGPHVVAVRVTDASRNQATAAIELRAEAAGKTTQTGQKRAVP